MYVNSFPSFERCLTSNLRVIRHAWHFYYAVVLVIKVACGSIGMACLTP
ncbi:DUF3265 domain-containing protein [Vibrio parahaemolyticus]|nr:DUF3265 domain-containing protein [Vibrio parahaemolyticus]